MHHAQVRHDMEYRPLSSISVISCQAEYDRLNAAWKKRRESPLFIHLTCRLIEVGGVEQGKQMKRVVRGWYEGGKRVEQENDMYRGGILFCNL